MLVLDTDHMSVLEWADGPAAEQLRQRLNTSGEPKATTIVTYEEQSRGWLAYIARAKSRTDQLDAYRRLSLHLQMYRRPSVTVLDFDEFAEAEFRRLKKSGVNIGTLDLRIAAIVLTTDATLLTANSKDFSKVPGLRFENWLSPSESDSEQSP